MNRMSYFARILCCACMLLVLISCRSAREPGGRIGARYDYPIMVAPQEYWTKKSPHYKETRAILLDDLADAIVRAIHEGHIQSLRGRIRSGEEEFCVDLARKGGGSIPRRIYRPDANLWTGKVISEIQTSIKMIRQELESMGIDPKAVRRVGSCTVKGKWLPAHADFHISGDSGQALRIRFIASQRRIGDKSFAWVLDGGRSFGGIYHTWLNAEQEEAIDDKYVDLVRTWTEEQAQLILEKRVNYRYLMFRFWPDLLEERVRTSKYSDNYLRLSEKDLESLRQSVTYSEWPNNYNKGKEVMRVVFDENGIAKQVFLRGKEVKAE